MYKKCIEGLTAYVRMRKQALTPHAYIHQLPAWQQPIVRRLRAVIRSQLPRGFKEVMQYHMISYVVPLRQYPKGYLNDAVTPLPYITLGAQKHHVAVYLFSVYADHTVRNAFLHAYQASGKKLNMGKSCVRFESVDDIPFEAIGEVVSRLSVTEWIELYEASRVRS